MLQHLRPRTLRWVLAASAWSGILAAPSAVVGQEPAAASLLAHVPDDFGLCLTVQDLRGRVQRWSETGWWKKVRTSSLGEALLQSREVANLLRVQAQLKKHLGVEWTALRDEVFGDAVVFAYRPGAGEDGSGEVGLLLLQARDPDLLAKLFAKINEAQKRSNEIKDLEERKLGRGTYWRRVQKDGTHFCFQEKGLFCLSNDEKLVREVLGRTLEDGKVASRWWADLQRAGADKAFVALAVGPRAFDAEIQAQAVRAAGAEGAFLRQFRDAWAALDRVVATLQVGDRVDLELTILHRASDLPAAWRTFFQAPLEPPGIWKRLPADLILAVGGTFDAPALWNLARSWAGEGEKNPIEGLERVAAAALGLDLVGDVLPHLGPDWGACLMPAEKPGLPPRMLAALAVRPGNGDVPVDQALLRGLEFLARLAVLEHNRTHPDPIRLRSDRTEEADIKYLAGKSLPPGVQPACAVKNGYLLLATASSAVAAFGKTDAAVDVKAGEALLVWLSAKRLAREFRDNRTWHLHAIAGNNGVSAAKAGETLDGVLAVLDLFDRLELVRFYAPGRWTWNLRVHLARD